MNFFVLKLIFDVEFDSFFELMIAGKLHKYNIVNVLVNPKRLDFLIFAFDLLCYSLHIIFSVSVIILFLPGQFLILFHHTVMAELKCSVFGTLVSVLTA